MGAATVSEMKQQSVCVRCLGVCLLLLRFTLLRSGSLRPLGGTDGTLQLLAGRLAGRGKVPIPLDRARSPRVLAWA
jgi:hypothetical protein